MQGPRGRGPSSQSSTRPSFSPFFGAAQATTVTPAPAPESSQTSSDSRARRLHSILTNSQAVGAQKDTEFGSKSEPRGLGATSTSSQRGGADIRQSASELEERLPQPQRDADNRDSMSTYEGMVGPAGGGEPRSAAQGVQKPSSVFGALKGVWQR